jgi:hypothetical protein
MFRGFPVHDARERFFFRGAAPKNARRRMCVGFRAAFRLFAARVRIQFALLNKYNAPPTPLTSNVHRFEESIAGRLYQIEVKNVAPDRWRAYIVRIPSVPTALMPFYGRTPSEAASLLCEWLTRAHSRTVNPPGTV